MMSFLYAALGPHFGSVIVLVSFVTVSCCRASYLSIVLNVLEITHIDTIHINTYKFILGVAEKSVVAVQVRRNYFPHHVIKGRLPARQAPRSVGKRKGLGSNGPWPI